MPWAGLVNGLIVTRIGINALIATLATMAIFRGLTYLTAGTGVTPIGDGFKLYGQTVVFGLQMPFWVMLAVVVIGAWLVAQTRYFRQFYFIGGNPRAAKLSGIRVQRLTLIGFAIMGTLAGLAGVLGAARLNSAVVSAGIGVELSVITATVLGGASLKGGEGTVLGGVLGVLFIALGPKRDDHQRDRDLLAEHHHRASAAAGGFAGPVQADASGVKSQADNEKDRGRWAKSSQESQDCCWRVRRCCRQQRKSPSSGRQMRPRPITGSPTRRTCRCSCNTTMSA